MAQMHAGGRPGGLSSLRSRMVRATGCVLWSFAWLALATTARAAEKVWVELERPENEVTVRSPVGLVEVRGWTGTGLRGGHDVLIAVDRSSSAWSASGADIDGDGRVGKNRDIDVILQATAKSTDPGDTILQAELLAARRLIERLDPETTRMGLMSFGGGAQVHALLGSNISELYGGLLNVPQEPDLGGTSFDRALKLAQIQFDSDEEPLDPLDRRNLSIILLSDGTPTVPRMFAEQFAIEAAREAGEKGIRIYAFALGPEAVGNRDVYKSMVEATGGELVLVDNPGDVTDFVPHISLTKISRIHIQNLSTSQDARAIRLFPDGTFDGFAPLDEGLNILRITAIGEDGYERVVDRRVYYVKTGGESTEEKAQMEDMLRELRVRTLETELAEAARKRLKGSTDRSLTIGIE